MPEADTKEILKQLESITHRGHSAWTVFEDWVSLMFYALQRNDEEYLKIVTRYKNDRPQGEREVDYFCNAFGLLMQKMSETNRELLGEIYMQWEVSSKHSGQFFTPWTVAYMMAQMTSPKGECINDPCCGSGIMFIAACKTMTNKELDKAVFVGQDIDLTCVMMCALNLTFFNLNGYVMWGNSLTNERRKVFRTTRSYLGGSLTEVPVESIPMPAIPERIVTATETVKPEKLTKKERQPVLFE
jgi:type I restriction-modification system DNA methylase subunit